jgi:arylsulfatase
MVGGADAAGGRIRQQKALAPDKPFFVYFAPGAMHAPHHVPKEWSDKYKGKFDQGWDRLREETFVRQQGLGVIPRDCQLTRRHPEIPAWETESAEMKPVLVRQMEIFAGFMEHTDYHIRTGCAQFAPSPRAPLGGHWTTVS